MGGPRRCSTEPLRSTLPKTSGRSSPCGLAEALSGGNIGKRNSKRLPAGRDLGPDHVSRMNCESGRSEGRLRVELIPGIVDGATILTVRVSSNLFDRPRTESVYPDPERRILIGRSAAPGDCRDDPRALHVRHRPGRSCDRKAAPVSAGPVAPCQV